MWQYGRRPRAQRRNAHRHGISPSGRNRWKTRQHGRQPRARRCSARRHGGNPPGRNRQNMQRYSKRPGVQRRNARRHGASPPRRNRRKMRQHGKQPQSQQRNTRRHGGSQPGQESPKWWNTRNLLPHFPPARSALWKTVPLSRLPFRTERKHQAAVSLRRCNPRGRKACPFCRTRCGKTPALQAHRNKRRAPPPPCAERKPHRPRRNSGINGRGDLLGSSTAPPRGCMDKWVISFILTVSCFR